jgi:hypothetical protein
MSLRGKVSYYRLTKDGIRKALPAYTFNAF